MAASRYWRLVGISTPGNGPLELSEARIYENGVLADASATLTASIAPASGSLADLRDGLTTGVVSWPYASYSQPGFALVWDFGAGAGVEFPQLRVGSGNSYASYLQEVICQSSVDGINWTYFATGSDVQFPGTQAMMPVPPIAIDQHISKVALLLHGNGPNGSTTIFDSSPSPKSVTAYGNAQISTVQSKFGGSSMAFDGNGDWLSTPITADFQVSGGDFTLETWAYRLSTSNTVQTVLAITDGVGNLEVRCQLSNTGVVSFLIYHTGSYKVQVVASVAFGLNIWGHLAFVRYGNIHTIYLNGINVGSATVAHVIPPCSSVTVGYLGYGGQNYFLSGYLDDLRVTKGVARYTANFAVPTVAFSEVQIIQTGTASAKTRQIVMEPERLLPATDLPPTTAHGHLREFPFFDVFNGGIGLITGTVKEKSLPSNAPLARKVWLMDEASGMVVRETWSDATTGNYEFRGVKQGVKYTVLAYDYTGLYRAVIADAQVPEAMP